MKRTLALISLAALALMPFPARGDEAGARERLEKAGVAFTGEAFLQKVAEGDVARVKQFLEAGIDPAVKNPSNRTALLFGPVNENHLDVVRLLLAAGAKLGEHKASLVEAATNPEMRAVLEAAE